MRMETSIQDSGATKEVISRVLVLTDTRDE